MTEDEKKEFEEFLEWKAEKAKQMVPAETKETSETPVDVEKIYTHKNDAPQTNTVSNNDADKRFNNNGLYILAAIMAIIFLFILVISLSNRKQSNQSEVEVDTVAVALPDDEVSSDNYKVIWNFTIAKDELYDTNNIWAEIKSDNYITQSFPYEGCTYAKISVRYMKKYGYDAIIVISKGQIHGNRYNGNNYITAKFDEGAPKKYYFNEAADGSSEMVFLINKSEFIKRCKQAHNIKIDIPIYHAGRPTFTFHVDEPLIWRDK